ncbi:MAG: hypothetical protein QOE33_2549, partial [Acidobacteriota bacterium]|nr:hypothetical protein [Acidobacteriota bacterium]
PPSATQSMRAPRSFELHIVTNTPGCRIFTDARFGGETDARGQITLTLRTGVHTIRAEQPGYFPAEQIVNAPRATAVVFSLAPQLFDLKVKTAPPAAYVSLDGRVVGRTGPDGQLTIPRLITGLHKLGVGLDEFLANEQTFNLVNDTTIHVALMHDPAVAAAHEIERALAAHNLALAFDVYRRAPANATHPALARSREAMLQQLHLRSQDALQRTAPDGLFIASGEADLLQGLFREASAWGAGDPILAGLADYWGAKNFEARIEQTTSPNERFSLALSERDALAHVGAATMRQYDLVLYDMGWCYLRRGDADAAERLFLQMRAQNSAWSLPRYALARVMLDHADHEADTSLRHAHLKAVVQNLTALLASNPPFAQALSARALALAHLGEMNEANAYAQNAVLLEPSSAYAHYVLGYVFFQRGKTRDARREIEAALSARAWELDDTSRRVAMLIRDQLRN